MVDRTPEIATLLRQKPAAEGRIQGIGRHNATEAALDPAWPHGCTFGPICRSMTGSAS